MITWNPDDQAMRRPKSDSARSLSENGQHSVSGMSRCPVVCSEGNPASRTPSGQKCVLNLCVLQLTMLSVFTTYQLNAKGLVKKSEVSSALAFYG